MISRIKRALGGHVSESDLSALADGELRGGAAARATRHVQNCDTCRAELEGLRVLKAMLAQAPRARPSRSFVLSGEVVSQAKGQPWPAFAWAPVAAFVALVLLLAVDVSGVGQNAGGARRDVGAGAPVAADAKIGSPGTVAVPRVPAGAGAAASPQPSPAGAPSAFGADPEGAAAQGTPPAPAATGGAAESQPAPVSARSHGPSSVLRYLEVLAALVFAGSLAYVVWRRSRDVYRLR